MKKFKKGFTITELIVVIVIVGILAAILIPNLTKWIEKARLSTDITNMTNINRVLAVEEVLEESPNDAIELESMLESRGLNLETKSKGNYYLYEKATGKVVLARIDGDRLEVVHRYGVSADEDDRPQVVSEILAPEDFFEGYWFVTTKSQDGFAQAIVDVRNGKFDNIKDPIMNISEPVYDVLKSLIETSVFINSEGKAVAGSDDANKIVNCIVSKDVKHLNIEEGSLVKNNVPVYPNLYVIDLPSNVKTATDTSLVELATSSSDIVVSYKSSSFAQSVQASLITTEQKSVFIEVESRSDFICTVRIMDGETELAKRQWKVTENGVEVNFTRNHKGSITPASYYCFTGYTFNNELVGEYIDTNLNTIAIQAVFESVTVENDSYVVYNQKYYSMADVVSQLNDGSIAAGLIKCCGLGLTIESDVTIPEDVSLLVPCINIDNNEYSDYSTILFINYSTSASDYYVYIDNHNNTYEHNKVANTEDRLDTTSNNRLCSKLTIDDGVEIINNGKIIVSAFQSGYSQLANSYAELRVNGTIHSNGEVYAYGNITSSEDLMNPDQTMGKLYIDDSFLQETLHILDWSSGSTANSRKSAGASPFDKWEMDRVSVDTIISGENADLVAFTSIFFGNSMIDGIETKSIALVGKDLEGNDGLFKLGNTASFEFKSKNSMLDIKLFGDIVDNAIKMVLYDGLFLTYAYDFTEVPFPLYKMNIELCDGCELTLKSNKYEMLDNSMIKVDEGATLNEMATFVEVTGKNTNFINNGILNIGTEEVVFLYHTIDGDTRPIGVATAYFAVNIKTQVENSQINFKQNLNSYDVYVVGDDGCGDEVWESTPTSVDAKSKLSYTGFPIVVSGETTSQIDIDSTVLKLEIVEEASQLTNIVLSNETSFSLVSHKVVVDEIEYFYYK